MLETWGLEEDIISETVLQYAFGDLNLPNLKTDTPEFKEAKEWYVKNESRLNKIKEAAPKPLETDESFNKLRFKR